MRPTAATAVAQRTAGRGILLPSPPSHSTAIDCSQVCQQARLRQEAGEELTALDSRFPGYQRRILIAAAIVFLLGSSSRCRHCAVLCPLCPGLRLCLCFGLVLHLLILLMFAQLRQGNILAALAHRFVQAPTEAGVSDRGEDRDEERRRMCDRRQRDRMHQSAPQRAQRASDERDSRRLCCAPAQCLYATVGCHNQQHRGLSPMEM